MAGGTYTWSQTAATNASADATINFLEGQAPSSVNDSARAMMAALRKHDDDITGAIATGGTSTAYSVTSYSAFSTLALMGNQAIAFTPHTTNGATVTLNVDGLGAKPLRSAPNTEIQAGVLVQGTPYLAVYNNSDAAFYLRNFYGNPYSIPIGGMLPYVAGTAPNSSFVLTYGQAISRSTYSALYALTSTNYGAGDGSTTFNVPDIRGRVLAGSDTMGGSAASRLTAASGMTNSGTIGGTGGGETNTLSQGNLPNVNFTIIEPNAGAGHQHTEQGYVGSSANTYNINSLAGGAVAGVVQGGTTGITSTSLNPTGITVNSGGSGTAIRNVQPTLVAAYILRVI